MKEDHLPSHTNGLRRQSLEERAPTKKGTKLVPVVMSVPMVRPGGTLIHVVPDENPNAHIPDVAAAEVDKIKNKPGDMAIE